MNNSNVLINKLIIILTQYRKFMQIKDIYIYIYYISIYSQLTFFL